MVTEEDCPTAVTVWAVELTEMEAMYRSPGFSVGPFTTVPLGSNPVTAKENRLSV